VEEGFFQALRETLPVADREDRGKVTVLRRRRINDFFVGDGIENHRSADGSVRERIDQDQAAGGAVLLVGIEEERTACGEFNASNFVHLKLLGSMFAEVVDIDAIANSSGSGFDRAAGMLEEIVAVQLERLRMKPDNHSCEMSRDLRRSVWRNEHVAA